MVNPEGDGPERPLGAYGLRVRGVAAAGLLVPAQAGWPSIDLSFEVGKPGDFVEGVGESEALLRLRSGGQIRIERTGRAAAARYLAPRPLTDEELVHPFLAPVAAVMAHWLDRESFHAGGVALGRDVWGVIGDRLAGKSSTLACLALRGYPVVADDLLVVDRSTGEVFAGPRSVDLREDAAERLGAGESLGMVGARERWRLRLDPPPTDLRLRGWIFLEWGDDSEFEELGGAERITLLAGQRGLRLPPRDPAVFLELASLPCFELCRRQDWSSLDPAVDLLLATIAA